MKSRTYLDTLSEDVLRNVVRLTSRVPRCEAWVTFIDPLDALSMLNADSKLAHCTRQLLAVYEHHRRRDAEERKGVVVTGDGKANRYLFSDLVQAAGCGVQQILISCKIGKKHLDLLKSSPNIQALSVVSFERFGQAHSGRFAAACIAAAGGEALQNLKLHIQTLSKWYMDTILTHCSNLRSLELHLDSIDPGQQKFWSHISPTLEELSLSMLYKANPFKLDMIATGPSKLQKVTLGGFPRRSQRALVALCIRARMSLETLQLNDCDVDGADLADICYACPSLKLGFANDLTKTFSALRNMGPETGPRIRNLTIAESRLYGDDIVFDDECMENMQNLFNLQEIHWGPNNSEWELFRQLLELSRKSLQKLRISYDDQDKVNEIFQLASLPDSRIADFEIRCRGPPTPDNLFLFVSSNKQLRKVRLSGFTCFGGAHKDLKARGPDVLSRHCEYIRILLCAPLLREFFMHCDRKPQHPFCRVPAYDDAWLPARYRNISVHVCGHSYS